MKKINCFTLVLAIILSGNFSNIFADHEIPRGDRAHYLQKLIKIQTPPPGVTVIQPCSLEEKKRILIKINQLPMPKGVLKGGLDLNLPLSIAANGLIKDTYLGKNYKGELYKGDFSNENLTEYALVRGVLKDDGWNNVIIFKLRNDRIFQAVQFLSADYSLQIAAKPFAIINNGKTYIRFLSMYDDYGNFTGDTYYADELFLYTYLLQDNKKWLYDNQSLKLKDPHPRFNPTINPDHVFNFTGQDCTTASKIKLISPRDYDLD